MADRKTLSARIQEKVSFLSLRALRRLAVGLILILVFIGLYLGGWRYIWPQDPDLQVKNSLTTMASAIYIYQIENDGVLPEPMGTLSYYNEFGQRVASDSADSYIVSGQIRPGFLPEEYMPDFTVDPRSNNYFRYSKTIDEEYFQLAGVTMVEGRAEALIEGNFTDTMSLISLIPDYQSNNFVSQRSSDFFPYNPVSYEETQFEGSEIQLTNAVRPLVDLVAVEVDKTKIQLRIPWEQAIAFDGFIVALNGEEKKITDSTVPVIVIPEALKGRLEIYAYQDEWRSSPSVELDVGQGLLEPGMVLYAGNFALFPQCGNGQINEGELCDGGAIIEGPLHSVCSYDCQAYECRPGYLSENGECLLADFTPPLVSIEVPAERTQDSLQVVLRCYDDTDCDIDSYRFLQVNAPGQECPTDYSLYDMELLGDSAFFDQYTVLCAAAKDLVGQLGFSERALEVLIDTDQPAARVVMSPHPYTIGDKDQPVTISLEAGDSMGNIAALYYSIAPQIDPLNYGTQYEAPFQIEKETVIYVVAVDDSGNRSPTIKQHVCGKNQVLDEGANLCLDLEKTNICYNTLMPDPDRAKWVEPVGVNERTGEYPAYYDATIQAYVPLESECDWICTSEDSVKAGFACSANQREIDCNTMPGVKTKPAIATWRNPLDLAGNEIQMNNEGKFITQWDAGRNEFDPLIDKDSCIWECPEGFHVSLFGDQCEMDSMEIDCHEYAYPKAPLRGEFTWLKPRKADGSEVFITDNGTYTAFWDKEKQAFDPQPGIDNCRFSCLEGFILNNQGTECVPQEEALRQTAPKPVAGDTVSYDCNQYADPPVPEDVDVSWLKPRKYDGTEVRITRRGIFQSDWNPELQVFDPPAVSSNCVWTCPDGTHRTADQSCAGDTTVYSCLDFVEPPADLETVWKPIVMADGSLVPVEADSSYEATWNPEWQRYEPEPNSLTCQWACPDGTMYGEGACIDEQFLFHLNFENQSVRPAFARSEFNGASSALITSAHYRFVDEAGGAAIKLDPQAYLVYSAAQNFNPAAGTIEFQVKLEELRSGNAGYFNSATDQNLLTIAQNDQSLLVLQLTADQKLKFTMWDKLSMSRSKQFAIPTDGEGLATIQMAWDSEAFDLMLFDSLGRNITPDLVEFSDLGGSVYPELPGGAAVRMYVGTDQNYAKMYGGVIGGVKVYGK